jgi:hypothetical protein
MICEENTRLKWLQKGKKERNGYEKWRARKKWLKRKKEMVEILRTSSLFCLGKTC